MQVSGYVKAVSSAGVFVALARNAEARVKMGHLSDSFVKDPKAAFPEGKLVQGRVISSADGRQYSGPFSHTFKKAILKHASAASVRVSKEAPCRADQYKGEASPL